MFCALSLADEALQQWAAEEVLRMALEWLVGHSWEL